MAVHIAQILCPKRHCIIALVYPAEDYTDDEAKAMIEGRFKELIDTKAINPWCGLCNSRDLRCEAARTKFATMEEALPHVKTEEAKQKITAALTALYLKTHPERN